jgi:hypothetical protein
VLIERLFFAEIYSSNLTRRSAITKTKLFDIVNNFNSKKKGKRD